MPDQVFLDKQKDYLDELRGMQANEDIAMKYLLLHGKQEVVANLKDNGIFDKKVAEAVR